MRKVVIFLLLTASFVVASSGCEQTPTEPEVASANGPSLVAEEAEPTPTLVTAELGETRTVHRMDNIWLCSQPAPEDIAALKKEQDVRTIINLRRPEETPDFDQAAFAESLGLTYHNPAFGGPDELTDEILDQALAVLADEANHPVAVYCSSANRVGAVWLAHRVVNDGVDFEAALEEARTVGLRNDAFIAIVRAYIEKHTPR